MRYGVLGDHNSAKSQCSLIYDSLRLFLCKAGIYSKQLFEEKFSHGYYESAFSCLVVLFIPSGDSHFGEINNHLAVEILTQQYICI